VRYFITLSYDGTAYHGWQVQPNAVTVQQRLNEALSTLLRQPTETVGAGRTDTGVHARFMVAHFDTPEVIDAPLLAGKLCRLLPPDIAVSAVRPVHPDAHARFDATSRTYHYDVYTQKSPFRRHYATPLFFTPDYHAMNIAADRLKAYIDFTSFSKTGTDAKTNICHVSHAEWHNVSDDLWRFEITADRFLRNMVRAIVGTLLEVGRGRMTVSDFCAVIEQRDRCAAGESVPAAGLSLVNITYPAAIFL